MRKNRGPSPNLTNEYKKRMIFQNERANSMDK